MTAFEQERELLSPGELEALIEEARDRQRRRRRRIALAIALVAAAGLGAFVVGGGGASHPPPVAAASPGAIAAFLARAERALDGEYSATYQVTVPYRTGSARRAVVSAAQLSRGRTVYRETPAFSSSTSPSEGTTLAWSLHGYEVFSGPNSEPRGLFSCTQARAASPWSCQGPYKGIGMGGTFALQGPYPPQALVLGLENATALYTGGMAIEREPAFLVRRRVRGRQVRCLQFGRTPRPLGSVCLNDDGVIAFFDLPRAVTYSTYATATLQSYSTNVKPDTFSLPAQPMPG
jgi:hypothetical protein